MLKLWKVGAYLDPPTAIVEPEVVVHRMEVTMTEDLQGKVPGLTLLSHSRAHTWGANSLEFNLKRSSTQLSGLALPEQAGAHQRC